LKGKEKFELIVGKIIQILAAVASISNEFYSPGKQRLHEYWLYNLHERILPTLRHYGLQIEQKVGVSKNKAPAWR
jgi:hypothetical protein